MWYPIEMNNTEIVYDIATQQFGNVEFSETTSFESLGADSLDLAEFFIELEEELDTSIPDDDIIKMKTLGDVIAYLDK